MQEIMDFLDPGRGVGQWLLRSFVVAVAGYVVVWFLAWVSCRSVWGFVSDNQLRVCFSWIASFVLHLALMALLIALVAADYKRQEMSLLYVLPYLLLLFVSAQAIYVLNWKVKQRFTVLERSVGK